MSNPRVIVLARYPELGKVKSRLAATVGDERALEIYRSLLDKTIEMVRSSALEWEFHWSGNAKSFADLPAGLLQKDGDIGQRMWGAVEGKSTPAIIIGTDCPDLTVDVLHQAVEKLKTKDVVFGPAHDGGYYLIGFNAPRPFLFENIAWSTSSVLKDSIEICNREGLTFGLLPELRDVDHEEDLIGTIYEKK